MPKPKEAQILAYYQALHAAWGPQHWWPASTPFEVIVGAYLTQNTSWRNVEIALRRLHGAGLLSMEGIRHISVPELESLIQPAGYFRQKAARLKTFVAFVDERYDGSLERMFAQPTPSLREELLGLNGVGPETADSILLYAGQHPVFVVDAYTRRVLERHGIVPEKASYDDVRKLCERALGTAEQSLPRKKVRTKAQRPSSGLTGSPHVPTAMSGAKRSAVAQVYNDMHGLIVSVGKHYCLKSIPECEECPLRPFLP